MISNENLDQFVKTFCTILGEVISEDLKSTTYPNLFGFLMLMCRLSESRIVQERLRNELFGEYKYTKGKPLKLTDNPADKLVSLMLSMNEMIKMISEDAVFSVFGKSCM